MSIGRNRAPPMSFRLGWAISHVALDRAGRNPEQACDILAGVGRLETATKTAQHALQEGV
jgi:hypothetical protein